MCTNSNRDILRFALIARHSSSGMWFIAMPGSPIFFSLQNCTPAVMYSRSDRVQSVMHIVSCGDLRSIANAHRAVHSTMPAVHPDDRHLALVFFSASPPGMILMCVVVTVGPSRPFSLISLKWTASCHTRSSTVCAVAVMLYLPGIVMSPTSDGSVGTCASIVACSSMLIVISPPPTRVTVIQNVFVVSGCVSFGLLSSVTRIVCRCIVYWRIAISIIVL